MILTELGTSGKPCAEHSISEKRNPKLSSYRMGSCEVFLLRIKLYYLKSNFQCPPIIGSNITVIGYLNCKDHKGSVIFNLSNLTHYLGKIIKEMSWYSKAGESMKYHTTGWPKGRNSHWSQSGGSTCSSLGYGRFNYRRKGRPTVKSLVHKRCYSADAHKNVIDRVNDLGKWCRENHNKPVDRKLYIMICNPDLLFLAYQNIKSKPGNMTPGIVPTTLDGMSRIEFEKLSTSLKNETFQFKPGRRIQIPKPGKTGTRPLTIAPPRDKIVQEAMRIVLEAIYEPVFLTSSHGFRPNRSCHSAWQAIYLEFKAISWIIEGDISKCFDSIDHKRLMNCLEIKIKDKQFIKLIWKSLRAGYFEFRHLENNLIGTPQGSIISPILANIFMHQLDVFVVSLRNQFNKGEKPRVSPAYTQVRHQKRKAEKINDIKTIKQLHGKLLKMEYTMHDDPGYKRLHYVRYADDWIIGIRGSKKDAEELRNQIKEFLLGVGLNLSEEKTKISNIATERIKFLGINMIRQAHVKYHGSPAKNHVLQRGSLKMRIEAPIEEIRKKLHLIGLLEKGIPVPRNIWRPYSHKQILLLYNSVLRGYLNYYSFVHNYSRLATYLYWVLKGSCGKLLASKFDLGSVSAALKEFGKDLSFKEDITKKSKGKPTEKIAKETKFYKPENWNSNYLRFRVNQEVPVIKLHPISISTLDELKCTKCGSSHRVEMHHIRMMKDLDPKLSLYDKLQIKLRRKQMPLCRACHLDLHKKQHNIEKT
uniref:Reverse transcriptase domain-containing protein n=1 Tax=Blastosporella zonata TaxID=530045 RepID=A0A386TXY1_9AGAR|nr:hypothetical protein C0991_000014 [Blastosporella zonata]AYE93077.1 hypothetical protein C0991_000014 [Blastosporella zonata]